MSYATRRRHNYHELSTVERVRYWLVDRWRISDEERFFFEGCRKLPGQMYIAERKGLFDTIAQYRPPLCFEVGTYTGGGSTFFLASAIANTGTGKLVTLEVDEQLFRFAIQAYAQHLPTLAPYIEFIHGSDVTKFAPYLDAYGANPFCFFLDGAEDEHQTVEQYAFFQPYLQPGTVLLAHDWETDKMNALRPLLENDGSWICKLRIGPPDSVGFVVYEYR